MALKWLEMKGDISDLQLQVKFDLRAHGGDILWSYISDFTYQENGCFVVEDSKGFKTPEYKAKKKHMLLDYGIKIRET